MKVKSVPWKLKDSSKLKHCDKDIVFITFGVYTKSYSI